MKSNQAIGQVVGMILVALITITLAGLAFVWATGYFQQTVKKAEGSTEMIGSWNMIPKILEASNDTEGNIYFYVKNLGSETVPENELVVFINAQLIENITHGKIEPREAPVLVNTTYKCTVNTTVMINVAAGSNSCQENLVC